MVFSFIPAFAAEEAPAAADKKAEETAKPEEKAEEKAEEVKETEKAAELPDFVKFLKDNGYVQGDKKNDLMLDKNLTRAEFTALLARLDGKDDVAKAMKTLGSKFTDVTEAHWAKGYISFAAGKDWVKGYPDGTFGPEREVTYDEIATVLVRYLGVDTMGFSYPIDYVAKAYELGLLKGLPKIENHKQAATRENMFHMLYNTISQRDFGRFNVYEMIVLANSRTATLKKNEIKAEVLSVVQQANNVDERGVAKIGTQLKFNVERKLADDKTLMVGDTENLLGKVIKATVNENGELVKAEIIDSYNYVWGTLDAATDKRLVVNGTAYDVRVDERYYNRYDRRYDNDDRMYRTYVTGNRNVENYNYRAFAKEFFNENGKPKKNAPDFVRATVKDGMVMFVDSYAMRDIAPVKEVKRDGKDVYFYNDARNGAVDRMTPADIVIGYTAAKEFYNMKAEDIKADDVIHMMDGVTLVRQDTKIETKLNKTYINRNGEYVVLEGQDDDYNLASEASGYKVPFCSVFAYDNNHFRRTIGRQDINKMVGENVKVLLSVYDDVQLISTAKEFKDTFALVAKYNSNYPVFYAPNAEKEFNLDVVRGTNFYVNGWNNTGAGYAANQFRLFDLVYTVGGEKEEAEVIAQVRPYDKDLGWNTNMKAAAFPDRLDRYVRIGGKDYRYDEDTRVFVVNGIKDGDPTFVKATMADVIKYNRDNYKLEAFVMTEKEVKGFIEGKLEMPRYGFYGDRDDLAKVVIFTNYKGADANLGPVQYGRVARIDNYSNSVIIELDRYEKQEYIREKRSKLTFKNGNGEVNDIVEFREVLDAENKTARFNKVLTKKESGRIVKGSLGINGEIYIVTNAGEVKKFFITKYTKEFGNNTGYATIYTENKSMDADVIVYGGGFAIENDDAAKYTIFKGELAKAIAAKAKADAAGATPADKAAVEPAVKALRKAFNDMSIAAQEQLVTPEDLAKYNALIALFPGQDAATQKEYDEAVAELKKLAAKDINSDALEAQAKALIKKVADLGAVPGISPSPTVSGDVTTLQGKVDTYHKAQNVKKFNNKKAEIQRQAEIYAQNNNVDYTVAGDVKTAYDAIVTVTIDAAQDDAALEKAVKELEKKLALFKVEVNSAAK